VPPAIPIIKAFVKISFGAKNKGFEDELK